MRGNEGEKVEVGGNTVKIQLTQENTIKGKQGNTWNNVEYVTIQENTGEYKENNEMRGNTGKDRRIQGKQENTWK